MGNNLSQVTYTTDNIGTTGTWEPLQSQSLSSPYRKMVSYKGRIFGLNSMLNAIKVTDPTSPGLNVTANWSRVNNGFLVSDFSKMDRHLGNNLDKVVGDICQMLINEEIVIKNIKEYLDNEKELKELGVNDEDSNA